MRGNLPRWISLLEVSLFYGLLLGAIWHRGYRPTLLLVALILVGLCLLSNRIHKDTLERIGLSKINFWPNVRLVSRRGWPVIFLLISMALIRGPHRAWDIWFSLFGYPVWAFAQEYALLGFVGNRLEDILRERRRLVPWFNGFLFSMAHLPNPVLMTIAFVAGVLFTTVFFRRRHLIPIAVLHAIIGILISMTFGDIRGLMSVGPAYLTRLGTAT